MVAVTGVRFSDWTFLPLFVPRESDLLLCITCYAYKRELLKALFFVWTLAYNLTTRLVVCLYSRIVLGIVFVDITRNILVGAYYYYAYNY